MKNLYFFNYSFKKPITILIIALSINTTYAVNFVIRNPALATIDTLKYNGVFKGYEKNSLDVFKNLKQFKQQNDTLKIAQAYADLASYSSNATVSLKYADSIINLTKNLKNFKFPGHGYLIKGLQQFQIGKYKKALQNYLIADEFAKAQNNIEQQLFLKNALGNLENFWGNHLRAIDHFKEIIEKVDKQHLIYNNKILYFGTLSNLSNSYIFANKMDSAFYYAQLGLKKSLKLKDTGLYNGFVFQHGILAYYKGLFSKANDSLEKAFPTLNRSNDFLNYYYYKAKIFEDKGLSNKAFYYYAKADSVYSASNDMVPEVRDIQYWFVNYYKNKKNIKKQLHYLNRLIYADSVITATNKFINNELYKKVHIPYMVDEKKQLTQQLSNNKLTLKWLLSGSLIIIVIGSAVILIYYQKQKRYKLRFKELVDQKKQPKPNTSKTKIEGISKEIVANILDGLDAFERNEDYKSNKITLVALAKQLETNSNYLSKVINTHKGKRFSNYITDLRIDFCIHQLKTDKNCRKYSIKAISEEIGFNNTESFSKAFYKKTGLYPSYFIKKLNKQDT